MTKSYIFIGITVHTSSTQQTFLKNRNLWITVGQKVNQCASNFIDILFFLWYMLITDSAFDNAIWTGFQDYNTRIFFFSFQFWYIYIYVEKHLMKLTVSKAFYMILAVMKSPVQVKINNTLKCLSIKENDYVKLAIEP